METFEHLTFELIDGAITGPKKHQSLVGEIDAENSAIETVGLSFDVAPSFEFSNYLMRGLGRNERPNGKLCGRHPRPYPQHT